MFCRLPYGIILTALFLVLGGTYCYAVTDPIVNAVDYANGLVKDASSVQEEYANYANTYTQSKIGELGDVNEVQKKTKKAKKIKDRYNKAQEKYNKAKALAEKAKEKKEALTKKADELKEKADELKKQYDDAMKKVEEAKNKVEEGKDKVEEGKTTLETAKENVSALKDTAEGTVSSAQDKASGTLGAAKEKAGISSPEETNTNEKISEAKILTSEATVADEQDTETSEELGEEADQISLPKTLLPSASNQALTAIEALTSEQEGVVTDVELPTTMATPQMMTTISADDVLELSEVENKDIVETTETMSEFNLEEQLLMSDQLKAKERKENAGPQLTIEDLRAELKAGDEAKLKALRESRRQSFGASKQAIKESADEK